jgi:MFS transporter, OPA family, glycerol-3-phosphate transporter
LKAKTMTITNDVALEEFRRRRFWNVIVVGLMYAFFYCGRYNFSTAHAAIAEQFGWSYGDYGIILTSGLLVYAFSVLFNGSIVDKIGGKTSLIIGAIGTAIFNFLFGLCSVFLLRPSTLNLEKKILAGTILDPAVNSCLPAILTYGATVSTFVAAMAAIWAFNHYFQSFGALSIVKINAAWVHVEERGRFAGWFGVLILIQLGRLMVYLVCPLILLSFPWQYTFWIPSFAICVMATIAYAFVKNRPEDLGYTYFDTPGKEEDDIKISLILKKIYLNKSMWIATALAMCLGFSRQSIEHWFPMYFNATYNLAGDGLFTFAPYKLVSILMPIAMIGGGLLAGFASDNIFGSRRGPVIAIGFGALTASLLLLYKYINSAWPAAICIIFCLLFIQAIHTIISGTLSMDIGGRKATGTATGLIDGAQYLMGSVAGYGVGRILMAYKPTGNAFAVWPLISVPLAIVGTVLAISIWNFKGKRTH